MNQDLRSILVALASGSVVVGGWVGCSTTVTDSGPNTGCGPAVGCGRANCSGTACSVASTCATSNCLNDCGITSSTNCSTCSTESCGTVNCGDTACSACGTFCGCAPSSCSTTTSACSTGATPLVLSFDDSPVAFAADDAHGFPLSARSQVTDWPTARTPWLAMDRDGDGRITSGEELFGSMTKREDGTVAKNGFEALADLDENHDGVIDAKDPAFAKLVVWRDADGDRASNPGELEPASRSIESIALDYGVAPRCDERGNCEVERARFTYRDASGAVHEGSVVDVHLKAQPITGAR